MISFPHGTKMFQFPWFATQPYEFRLRFLAHAKRVAPFGNPRIKTCLAVPRGLSQLTTSFIADLNLGIHHAPLQ